MKKIIFFFAAAAVAFTGCETEDVGRFDFDKQMIRLSKYEAGFSFNYNPAPAFDQPGTPKTGEALNKGTLTIPFEVIGAVSDVERYAAFSIDIENSSTFPLERFRIVSAVVPAGTLTGQLTLEFTRPQQSDFPVPDDPEDERQTPEDFEGLVYLKTATGGDFYVGPEVSSTVRIRTLSVTVSTKRVKPDSWTTWDTAGLGRFSSSYYEFIVEATKDWDGGYVNGLWEYPLQYAVPGMNMNADGVPQTWPSETIELFRAHLRTKLSEYNAAHPDAHLVHDSGAAKGYEVVVGQMRYL